MQLDLGFHDRPEASVWERLDNEGKTAVLQALTRLMIKAAKKNILEESDNARHE